MSHKKEKIILISLLTILLFIFYFIFNDIKYPITKKNVDKFKKEYDITKEDPLDPGTTCDYFSYLDYELPGETVKSLFQKANKVGYVSSVSFDKVETETLEEYNKKGHPTFAIKEGDLVNFDWKFESVKDGIVYSNYYDNMVIEKKVNDVVLQMRVKDVYVGPDSRLDKQAIEEFNNSEILNIKKNINDPVLGKPDSPIIITIFLDFNLSDKLSEYGDYQRSEYLKTINRLKKEFVSAGKAYLVIKHNLSSKESSTLAGQGAQCANEQGKFWEMHDIIFANRENQTSLNINSFLKWAEDLGMDTDQYKSCLVSSKTEYLVKDGFQNAIDNNLYGGGIAFVINGKLIRGGNYLVIQNIINKKLEIENDYIQTRFSIGVLNVCFAERNIINNLLKEFFLDLELDTEIINKIPLEKNHIMELID